MGPAEALWYERLQRQGHDVDVLSVSHLSWLTRDARQRFPKPDHWVTSITLQKFGNQISTYFGSVINSGKHEVVVASGLQAAGIAARQVSLPVIPLLWREDLDFRRARTIFTRRFEDLTESAAALFLEDDFEFDKALSKGSKSVHLLHPQTSFAGLPPLLGNPQDAKKIAVVFPEGGDKPRAEAIVQMLDSVATRHGNEVVLVSSDSLYRARDLMRGHTFAESAQSRLAGVSHVVMVGASRHASSLGQYLLDTGQSDRLVVEDTIGQGGWARQQRFTRTARGGRLALVVENLLSDGPKAEDYLPNERNLADSVPQVLERLSDSYPVNFEELEVVAAEGPFNAFFSSTGLEDRTNGARPQRIRNMAQAVEADLPTVRLASNENGFRRRRDLIRALLESGREPRMFYGENSTSPIPAQDVRVELGSLLALWGEAGGRSAWFVRDLHWLDEATGIADPTSDGTIAPIVTAGLHELKTVGEPADILLAPDDASVEGFQRLLSGFDAPDTEWSALPPGVAEQNVVDAAGFRPTRSRPTILYAGGIGAVYSMTNFLTATQPLIERGYFLDFVIRPGEGEELEQQLEEYGIANSPQVSVTTNALDVYLPQSRVTIGAILLDSEYAKFSFPYKTVSMLEKGFPIITYSDMAIADFVEAKGVGVVAERNPQSILTKLESMHDMDFTNAIAQARKSESWTSRVGQVKRYLGVGASVTR
ncbi:hypothetical protein C7K25_06095 [Gulosibacter molinativorax]|uniref:Glucosyltransferase 3-like C-terminal domain-containing protein n=2 Tax=Gulosibacter molinativorax TaxID=256821 RepID=A0ABT7C6W8_9MICO|nr:hypothetical protein [Gulosibacter molinativorax]